MSNLTITGEAAVDPNFNWAPAYLQYTRDGHHEEWLVGLRLSNTEADARHRCANFRPGCVLNGWRWRPQSEIDAQKHHKGAKLIWCED